MAEVTVGQSRDKMQERAHLFPPSQGRDWMSSCSFKIIASVEELRSVLDVFNNSKNPYMAVDTETTGLHWVNDYPVGLSFCFSPTEGYYVPLAHKILSHPNLDSVGVAKEFERIFAKQQIKKMIFFNFAFDCMMLRNAGFDFLFLSPRVVDINIVEDAQVLSFLYDSNFHTPSLKVMSKYVLGFDMISYSEVVLGKSSDDITKTDMKKLPTMDLVPTSDMHVYACSDAIVTYNLFLSLLQFVTTSNMLIVYDILKKSGARIHQLMLTPIPAHIEYLEVVKKQVTKASEDKIKKLHVLAGRNFEVNSIRQLAQVLLDCGVPLFEQTRTGLYSTSEGSLEPFEKDFEIVKEIMKYRHLLKAGGYLEALATAYPKSDSVPYSHFFIQYNSLSIPTARLSSGGQSTKESLFNHINIQQMPKSSNADVMFVKNSSQVTRDYVEPFLEDMYICFNKPDDCASCGLGCKILKPRMEFPDHNSIQFRKMYIPLPGHIHMSCDYSSQELYIPAFYSNETVWLSAIDHGKDLHKMLAAKIYSKSYDDISKDERRLVKTVSFRLLYGGSSKSIARDFGLSYQQSDFIYNSFFREMPNLAKWMELQKELMRQRGFIENAFGFRRYMTPWLRTGDYKLMGSAERSAVNTFIQSTAAFVMRIAFMRFYTFQKDMGLENDVVLVSTIHDEMNFSVNPAKLDLARELVNKSMVFDLPNLPSETVGRQLKISTSIGRNWEELVEIA